MITLELLDVNLRQSIYRFRTNDIDIALRRMVKKVFVGKVAVRRWKQEGDIVTANLWVQYEQPQDLKVRVL